MLKAICGSLRAQKPTSPQLLSRSADEIEQVGSGAPEHAAVIDQQHQQRRAQNGEHQPGQQPTIRQLSPALGLRYGVVEELGLKIEMLRFLVGDPSQCDCQRRTTHAARQRPVVHDADHFRDRQRHHLRAQAQDPATRREGAVGPVCRLHLAAQRVNHHRQLA